MDPEEMARCAGRYANRWTMEVFIRDGQLVLKRFDVEMPVTRIGENRVSILPPGASGPDEFLILPEDGATPACLQMFLWSFKRQ